MLHYHPPKSQSYGHRVGRLTATQVVDRSLRFLDERAILLHSHPSELRFVWNPDRYSSVSVLADEIILALGPAPTHDDRPHPDGGTERILEWPVTAGHLTTVARWFDRISDLLANHQIVARCSIGWHFAWRDEPPPVGLNTSAGGYYMIHLGWPHRISMAFSFREIEKYDAIKAYLETIGLVRLSDRNLSPKGELRRIGRAE
jgi:hypothetical protein